MTRTYLGDAPVAAPSDGELTGELVRMAGRDWYEIRNYDRLPPFFISLVSSHDHWWFVSSSGGMTAGRVDADHALLPYETEDRISLGVDTTGPLTILRVHVAEGHTKLWEPLSTRTRVYRLERRLRKSVEGDALCFEETNLDLGLTYTMTLRTGDEVGFVRTVELRDESGKTHVVDVIDGYRNVLPHGATEVLQARMSSLLDAYKRSERDPKTGVALYSLSSTLTDRAEASEALRANVFWSLGLPDTEVLLTPDARIEAFRRGEDIRGDLDVRGHRGAFLLRSRVTVAGQGAVRWHVVSEVSCDAKAVGKIRACQRDLSEPERENLLERDIAKSTAALRHIVGRADGLSASGDRLSSTHHFANTLFNVMRGGVFVDGERVETRDFANFVSTRNRATAARTAEWLGRLPASLHIGDLFERAERLDDRDLTRLVLEYLPLTFSRRHGDPSRPWNRFSIRLRNDDGSPRTDYQGNWRDIFQNWEPLAYSYPPFAFSMVAKFLNATTVDGYNPYRVTRDGIEWEEPEPDNPWANLGYWGDHQIIYLQKLLEAVDSIEPGRLRRDWNRARFTYADVPYRLATYDEMIADWEDTVRFDHEANARATERVDRLGTDGRLVHDADGIRHATMVEKLLVLLLAKITNLVPGGGIWMNTQRPEWNDANNALVGKGVSMVTAAYLRRFIVFWQSQLAETDADASFTTNAAVAELARSVTELLRRRRDMLDAGIDDRARRALMDELGALASEYRARAYDGLPRETVEFTRGELGDLLRLALAWVDHTLDSGRRSDGLFHSYLVLELSEGSARVHPLDLMLEGQVAALSSGYFDAREALAALRALAQSPLYWPEQHTYLLYPNKELPGFLAKNTFASSRIDDSALARALRERGDERLVILDPFDGQAHFGGDLRNAGDVSALLDELRRDDALADLVDNERSFYLALFEEVFDHRAFTGRSGTFFAYEGLGSVYWHMVSKLLLAAQESCFSAADAGDDDETTAALASAYYDVRAGLGFQKDPARFGTFPTDPYSHTPETGQARQPGMTGQVKEELLTRMGELGLRVRGGELHFDPRLVRATEGLTTATTLEYVDVDGAVRTVAVPAGGLAFTFAQTPIVHTFGDGAELRVTLADGSERIIGGDTLPRPLCRHLFARDGHIRSVHVRLRPGR